MKHELPPLDFAPDALAPFLSAETLEYHHGKHHRTYVKKLNGLLEGSELAELPLTDVVKRAKGGVFNNAAQHYNHSLYWRCIAPGDVREPDGVLSRAIEQDFGSLAELEQAFTKAATGHFGSGWCWLVKAKDERLRVRSTSDAGCPLTEGEVPLLTCDVWEHAYYIDYRNERPKYVSAFWKAVNWGFVSRCLTRSEDVEDEILKGSVPST